MAKSKSRKKSRSKKRPTKAELEKQKALKRFGISVLTAIIFFFAIIQLGRFGVTTYNVVRFAVGSLAYFLMFSVLIYIIGFKWLHKKQGLVGGFVITMIGLLLEWQAYLFSLPENRGHEVFTKTARIIFDDLISFKVSAFAGGGMLGDRKSVV